MKSTAGEILIALLMLEVPLYSRQWIRWCEFPLLDTSSRGND